MGARVRLLCEFTGTVVSVLPKMAATYRYDTGIRVPAGIGIPVWLLSRYEHPYYTGENLKILRGGRKTSRERANSLLDENHS